MPGSGLGARVPAGTGQVRTRFLGMHSLSTETEMLMSTLHLDVESCLEGPQGSVMDEPIPDKHRNHDAAHDEDGNTEPHLLFEKAGAVPVSFLLRSVEILARVCGPRNKSYRHGPE